MAEEEPPPRWRKPRTPKAEAPAADGEGDSTIEKFLAGISVTRRGLGERAIQAGVAAAVAPEAVIPAGASIISAASPAIAAAAAPATVPPTVALLAAKMYGWDNIVHLLSGNFDGTPTASYEAAIIQEAFSTGILLDEEGKIDYSQLLPIQQLNESLKDLNLYADNGKLRELRLSQISPGILQEAITLSELGDIEKLEGSAQRLQHVFAILTGIEDNGSTLGEYADILREKSIQVVEGILQNPQLMPDDLKAQFYIYYFAQRIMDNLVRPDEDKGTPAAQLLQRVNAEYDRVEVERRSLSGKPSDTTTEDATTPHTNSNEITYKVLRMSPRQDELGQVFLLQPAMPPLDNTIPHINAFCGQLKEAGLLESNFRPASVKSEWIAAGAEDNHTTFGMRISTADYELKKYLNEKVNSGETITLPTCSIRQQYR